jgi:hypothetical protein
MHPDGVKRAVIAGLGIAMVSKLTVKDDVRRKLLAIVSMKAGLPSRPIVVVDHRQKHHRAACRAMLQALETAFPMERYSTSQVIAKRVEQVRSVADIVQCGLVFVTRCNCVT